MAYDGRVMRLALEQFDEDRRARSEEQERRRERVFARQPRLREIEGELRSTMSRIIAQALRQGTDPVPAVERLRDENLRLQEEKRTLLEQMGLPADYLEEKPVCPICNDTGYHAGRVCRCLRAYYAKEQQKELSRMLDLGNQSFDTFELEWYSDQVEPGRTISYQENMKWVYDVCAEYAHRFGRKPGNLLLLGAPGLGKTHLSAAIAREVSGRGYSVVYDTASHIFERFESQKFGREDEAQEDVERVLELRPFDSGRPGNGDDHGLCPKRSVSDSQHPADGKALHHCQYEPDPHGSGPAVYAADCLPHRGRVSDSAVFGQDIRKLKKSRQKP
ncbi:MAG: ATP-binding protein [Dysosmobacter sp.]